MAVFTRTCWYDRAGVGWSDPPLSPRTSASIASDVHEMLRRAGVLPPYVMVGSSDGDPVNDALRDASSKIAGRAISQLLTKNVS
jgi:pimeloyl-ACP methyl ester carboxylesterase